MERTTPYLSIDVVRMQRNIQAAASRAWSEGVALRPHVKTHKIPEIAKRQLGAGAQGITVATIGEAEVFVRHGCLDVFIAYPLWLDEVKWRHLSVLSERAKIRVGVDSFEGAARLAGLDVEVLVEVNSGHHRSGVDPDSAGEIAVTAAERGLNVIGAFTFPGHSYAPNAGGVAADDESAALERAAEAMVDAGLQPTVLSGGSTPSFAAADFGVLSEVRPGVYVFGDAQQWELGTMARENLALTCRATVISHAGGRLVLDSGSKILGADRAAWATGFGRLLDYPNARIVQLSEHHAVVDLAGAELPALGSQVDVVPNHACNAINQVDVVHAGGQVWRVEARGRF